MIAIRKRSLRVAIRAAWLPLLLVTVRASAEVAVSIQVESDAELEVARRVTSELSSEGYAVEIVESSEPSPCDARGEKVATVPQGTKVWIRLGPSASENEKVVASICYLGAMPFLQQASVSAPKSEPHELALAAAEALNGLRSKLPPLANDAERAAHRDVVRVPPRDEPLRDVSPPAGLVNSAVIGMAVVRNFPDFPTAPGVVGRATLGVVPSLGIAIDTFFPVAGRELVGPDVTATVRTAWLRVGPRFGGAIGDLHLSGAALAGPAVTWATAVAELPRVGGADVTTGAVLTLAAFFEYPRRGPVFACGSASASALLPGVKVNLGDGAPVPRGSWPLETSIGVGARWGGDP
jgi:hypothetical protein